MFSQLIYFYETKTACNKIAWKSGFIKKKYMLKEPTLTNRKIILIPHCVLVHGFSNDTYRDEIKEIMSVLLDTKTGIMQLPCPYLSSITDRNGGDACTITETENSFIEYNKKNSDTKLYEKILCPVLSKIKEYKEQGIQVNGLIGVKGSPTCSTNTNSYNKKDTKTQGQFIKALLQELKEHSIAISMADIKMPHS